MVRTVVPSHFKVLELKGSILALVQATNDDDQWQDLLKQVAWKNRLVEYLLRSLDFAPQHSYGGTEMMMDATKHGHNQLTKFKGGILSSR